VGTPLHCDGLSEQRRGSMDARQEASPVWVCLVAVGATLQLIGGLLQH